MLNENKSSKVMSASLALSAVLIIVGCIPQKGEATDSHVALEYATIRKEIGPSPSEGVTSWGMNCDHLFLAEKYGGLESGDTLRERCERFTREPGALDYLFGRLLDSNTKPEDALANVQILVFWAMKDDPGDGEIKAHLAPDVLTAIQKGKLLKWDVAFPCLGVSWYAKIAAKKGESLSVVRRNDLK